MEFGPAVQQELSPNNNVARYCRKRDMAEDGTPMDGAFLLKDDVGENYLSTNWLECFHPSDRRLQINGVIRSLRAKSFNVRNNASFAVLNVGVAINDCQRQLNLELRFVVLGDRQDPSHTGIYGYAQHNAKTAAVLAKSVNPGDVYPARDIH